MHNVKVEETDYAPLSTPPRSRRTPVSTPVTPTPSSRRPIPPPRASRDNTSGSSQPEDDASSPPSLSPLLSQRVFDLSLAEANGGHELLYQYTRNLRGIKDTHTFPVMNDTKVPSCGRALDGLLQAFGYDVGSKLEIAYACRSESTMEGFVRRMMASGLPVLEAKYMWMLYVADTPVEAGVWAQTHIM